MGHDNTAYKETDQRYISANGQLKRPAQSMTAGSPIGKTGTKHGNDAANKSRCGTL